MLVILGILMAVKLAAESSVSLGISAVRAPGNPIITPEMLPEDDRGSINGPSVIRVPNWVEHPLGRYYLYFAHHRGKYIRMAYADRVEGPWKIFSGGVLALDRQHVVRGHIASPEAIVDESTRKIVLFFHGGGNKGEGGDPEAGQISSVATSTDGLHFKPINVTIGPAYLRVFRHGGDWFAIEGRGDLLRGKSIDRPFEKVAQVIGPEIAAQIDPVKLGEPGAHSDRPQRGPDRYSIRHVGIDIRGNSLVVYFSCVGHRPERLLATTIEMKGDPSTWRAKGVQEVLHPETVWEGSDLPLEYSKGGVSKERERGVRDPMIFRDGDVVWLIYSIAGEHGLALARIQYGI